MRTYLRPEFLKPGDRVLILSPSSHVSAERIMGAKQRMESWGLTVELSKHALGVFGRFAATAQDRLSDFQEALDREDIQAIFCSRGGYGAVHLLDSLQCEGLRRHPKWLMGYSDITALHMMMSREGIMSLHSPMAKHLHETGEDDVPVQYIRDILFGHIPQEKLTYHVNGHPLNREGEAEGTLLGGNLSVWHGLRNTPWDFDYKDSILFIEDIGEYPHNIERMIWNMRLSGILSRVKGIIFGQFSEVKNATELESPLYEALRDVILPVCDCPVCFGFPVGHVGLNLPMVEGAMVRLTVSKENTELKFLNL